MGAGGRNPSRPFLFSLTQTAHDSSSPQTCSAAGRCIPNVLLYSSLCYNYLMKLISRIPPSIEPYINKKMGKLLIQTSYYCPDNKRYYAECLCDCGKSKTIRFDSVKSGAVVSCGCYSSEITSRRLSETNTTHGMSGTSIYNRWIDIRMRCNNQGDEGYDFYGGRGVRVCQRWNESFEAFYEDVGNIGSQQTIDRINNNGHYSCGKCDECKTHGWTFNVRLVPMSKQNRNRRSNINVTMKGRTMVLGDWAKELGVNPKTVYTRISRGWSADNALTVPARTVDQSWRDRD